MKDSLYKLQLEFQRALLHGEPSDWPELTDGLIGAGELSGAEALGLYKNMYKTRMLDALKADFPATAVYFGAEEFDRFTTDYLREYPSKSYSLNFVGRFFPIYSALRFGFATSRVAQLIHFESQLAQIARVEEDKTTQPSHQLGMAGLTPAKLLTTSFIVPHTTRQHCYNYDLSSYHQCYNNQPNRPDIVPCNNLIVFSRNHFKVKYRAVAEEEQILLLPILAGKTIEEALTELPSNPDEFLCRVTDWFRSWVEDGIIRPPTGTS